MNRIVLPFVHLNGTSRNELCALRHEAHRALRLALEALAEMTQNARDYYPVPGLFEKAMAQHRRRVEALSTLRDEIQAEGLALANVLNPSSDEGDPA